MITVLNPGLFTTVQDEGRFGYQAYGMPVSGAMDGYAYAMANILAGNEQGSAALEMTVYGGSFQFHQDVFVAVCGADMEAKLDGNPLGSCWCSFWVFAGSRLTFGPAVNGCRTYLAVRGGIDVPPVMGSRSTYVRGGLGGFKGRPLDRGDVINIYGTGSAPEPRGLPPDFIPEYRRRQKLRVLPGPQDDLFTLESVETFFSEPYTIGPQWDRMGCRLEGRALKHKAGADIISDAACPGAIQVPGGGMPIILTADRQTTGGYTKIGAVIGADIMLLAQMKPGDEILFCRCPEEEAVDALKARQEVFRSARSLLKAEGG